MLVCLSLNFFGSALTTAPTSTSARAGAKEAINFIETCFLFVVSNQKTTTSKQHKKLKFGMQSYFNPTKRNMKKNWGYLPHQEAEIRYAVLVQPK